MKKNNKITLVLFIVLVLLIITFIFIPTQRTKKVYISKEDYKNELINEMKRISEENEQIQYEKDHPQEESDSEDEYYLEDELLKVQN